jgi:predicted permease
MTKKSFRFSDIRPDPKREVDDELAFHLEMRAREFMERGLSEEEARREAAKSFGDVQEIRGDLRQDRAARNEERAKREWWNDLRQDLRYSMRALLKHRGFALAAIATLALGIGANSTIFSIVNSVLLRPLPFPDSDRLVVVHGRYPEFGRTSTSLPDFRDWRDGTTGSFARMAARYQTAFNFTGGDEPVQLRADRVTANFFQTVGVSPVLGRGFRPEEELGGDDFVVVLAHGFWERQFGGDPKIVGQTIQLSGRAHTVIGVAPPRFRFWRDVDLWAPATVDAPDHRRSEYLTVFGRLQPGVSVERARTEVATVVRRLAEQYPASNGNLTSEVVTLHDQTVADVRPALVVFAAAVGLVLLIACANVANLLMARAAAREREIAVRSALGASRSRLMRQLLTESTVVGMAGGMTGLLLALWAIGSLRATGTTILPRLAEVRVDLAVVLFSIALSLVTGLLFGLAPALRLASSKLHESIKEGARGAAGGSVTRFRNALVLAEVALAVVLLVGAGLLIRSFEKLNGVNPGFDPNGVLTYQMVFPRAKYQEAAALLPLYDQLLDRTRSVPGVRAAAVSATLPMQGSGYVTFAVEGRTSQASVGAPPEDVQPFNVSSDYFKVMGIPLLKGRLFEASDATGALDVAIINTEMVRKYMPPGREPIGTRITFGNPADTAAEWWTVVGIVDVVAQEGLDAKPYAQIYIPIAQSPRRSVFVALRTEGDPMAVIPGVRQALRSVDADLPMNDVKTMRGRVAESIAAPRVSVAILTLFAVLALLLAAIGIYGVLSYAVAQRTREIGIRMALGASATNVRRLIVRQGMTPALLGLVVGLGGAVLVTRLMAKLLFGVAPTDPATFVSVALFLSAVAFLASYLPARRATLVAPTEALRYD